jgi:hypothetical protein
VLIRFPVDLLKYILCKVKFKWQVQRVMHGCEYKKVNSHPILEDDWKLFWYLKLHLPVGRLHAFSTCTLVGRRVLEHHPYQGAFLEYIHISIPL